MRGENRAYGDHLANDLLIRYLDDELSSSESALVTGHLSNCEGCKARYLDLRRVAVNFDSFVASLQTEYSEFERRKLEMKLEEGEPKSSLRSLRKMRRAFRNLAWTVGIAATLALAVLFVPRAIDGKRTGRVTTNTVQATTAFEIDGEAFIALPYSNPELPIANTRIVQMQLPLSSLAEAGLVVEPISGAFSAPDRPVLADILLGIDGQPLGVHVLAVD
jgi:anti-sigma factor RsiW